MKLSRMAALLGASVLAGAAALANAADKPKELNIGISTYLSGSASVFGVPARDAAEILIQEINANGGIDGVKLVPSYIDEGGGARSCCPSIAAWPKAERGSCCRPFPAATATSSRPWPRI